MVTDRSQGPSQSDGHGSGAVDEAVNGFAADAMGAAGAAGADAASDLGAADAGTAGARRANLDAPPLTLQYRTELVESLTALVSTWSSPRFERGMARAKNHHLSSMEIRVLWLLGSRGRMRASLLSDLIGTGAPTVSKAVTKLIDAGFVAAVTDPRDRRAHPLQLTDAGLDVARDLYDAGDEMMVEILEDWSETDVRDFTRHVARFREQADTFADRLQER